MSDRKTADSGKTCIHKNKGGLNMNADKELDRLRLELRDRDLEIINLQAQIRLMRGCQNCANSIYDGADYHCRLDQKRECYPPGLQLWRLNEK